MKHRRRRGMSNSDYTMFGQFLRAFLVVVTFISVYLIFGYTASCELGAISPHEYIIKVVPCLASTYGCMYLYDNIFGGKVK